MRMNKRWLIFHFLGWPMHHHSLILFTDLLIWIYKKNCCETLVCHLIMKSFRYLNTLVDSQRPFVKIAIWQVSIHSFKRNMNTAPKARHVKKTACRNYSSPSGAGSFSWGKIPDDSGRLCTLNFWLQRMGRRVAISVVTLKWTGTEGFFWAGFDTSRSQQKCRQLSIMWPCCEV